jgi:hypothetical protein
MRTCIGRRQRQIRRAFIAANGEPVRTSTLMAWVYPHATGKLEVWRWPDVARSARRFGVNIKRGLWAPNEASLRQIRGEAENCPAANLEIAALFSAPCASPASTHVSADCVARPPALPALISGKLIRVIRCMTSWGCGLRCWLKLSGGRVA